MWGVIVRLWYIYMHTNLKTTKHPCCFERDGGFLIDPAFSLWLSCSKCIRFVCYKPEYAHLLRALSPPTRYSSKQQLPFRLGNTMLKHHAKCSVFGCSRELKPLYQVPEKEDRNFIFDGKMLVVRAGKTGDLPLNWVAENRAEDRRPAAEEWHRLDLFLMVRCWQ